MNDNKITVDEELAFEVLLEKIYKMGKTYNTISFNNISSLNIVQKLCYALGVTDLILINYPQTIPISKAETTLFVDVVERTSKTLSNLTKGVDSAVLVQRDRCRKLATYVGRIINNEDFVEFSWEK